MTSATKQYFAPIPGDGIGPEVLTEGCRVRGNLIPERTTRSMVEPCHGSAPDIAGLGIANPLATTGLAKLMLDWLGQPRASEMVGRAIEDVLAETSVRTPDLGGTASTSEMADAVLEMMSVGPRR